MPSSKHERLYGQPRPTFKKGLRLRDVAEGGYINDRRGKATRKMQKRLNERIPDAGSQ